MSSKAEKERLKQIQDKCQNLLMQMLKDDDNKYCVDCDAKGPRWASWNIGIFLCIRCAGIHRNLGVHISRVKSVNLDTWTPEQVVSLQQMGNSRARAVYEANIPDNFRRPQTDSALEAFIRAKYEQKKYIASEWVAPALPKVNWDKEFEEEAERARRKKKDPKSSAAAPVRPPLSSVPVPAPLPKPMASSPKTARTKSGAAAALASTAPAKVSSEASADLLGLDISSPDANLSQTASSANNSSSSLDSEFNSFLSASTPANVQVAGSNSYPNAGGDSARTAEEDSFFNQPVANAQAKKQLTTDSILALYGKSTPSLPAQVPVMPQAMFTPQGMQPNMGGAFPPAQVPFGSPFAPRATMPNTFPPENPMFASNQYMANPFYNMGAAQQPNSLPQTNGQQFQFATPMGGSDSKKVLNGNGFDLELGNFDVPSTNSSLHLQMGNLNMAGSSMPHPMGVPAQPFQSQPNFFNSTPNPSTQPLNPMGQTLSNNLWQ